jgi:hypothetical protein
MANSMSEVGTMMSASAPVEGAGETPPQASAPVEGHTEPRSGEFAVTDTAAPASSNEPAAP